MLRICNLAGETLATFNADEVDGKRVHHLKKSLAKQIGATRFQQRWLTEDHSELQDDAVVPCCDVQLVVQSFVQAEEEEMGQLLSACKENRPDELVDLLRKPLSPPRSLVKALHMAVENGFSQIVEILLEAGANPDMVYSDDDDEYGFDLFDDELGGRTALHLAAKKGNSEVVKLLLEAGANKEATKDLGEAPLHLAAKKGNSEVVKLLLEAGADKDVADNDAYTALHFAAQAGHLEVAILLLEAGAEKDAVDFCEERTALHFAAENGHSEIVKLLLDAGADKAVADSDGKLPSDLAFDSNHIEVFNLLQA